MKKRIQIILIFSSALLCIRPSHCQNLDVTFNGTGIFTTAIGISNDNGRSVLIDNSGKIVVGGYSQVGADANFSAIRLSTTGMLDNSFDSDGKILSAITAGGGLGISLGLLSSNNLIFSGYTYNLTNLDYAVLSLIGSNGSPDGSYATSGKSVVTVSSSSDIVNEMAIQSDDKIVLVGDSSGVPCIIRLTTTGILDNSFGGNGIVVINNYTLNSIAIQSDGKIVVAGNNSSDFAILRVLTNGILDNSFGTNGLVLVDMGSNSDKANSVRMQKDGKIIVGGTDNSDFLVCRLNSDGSIDNTFDTDGKQSVNFHVTDICYSIAEDTNTNKIILGGYSFDGTRSTFAVARLSSTGSLEANANIVIGSGNSEARSIVIQSDSKIILAGHSNNGTNDDFAVVRVLSNFVTDVTAIITTDVISQSINLFPNPSNHYVNLNSIYTIEDVRVLDVLGNEVLRQTKEGNTQIDISSLPKGLYNFVITTDRGLGTKKVSVQ